VVNYFSGSFINLYQGVFWFHPPAACSLISRAPCSNTCRKWHRHPSTFSSGKKDVQHLSMAKSPLPHSGFPVCIKIFNRWIFFVEVSLMMFLPSHCKTNSCNIFHCFRRTIKTVNRKICHYIVIPCFQARVSVI